MTSEKGCDHVDGSPMGVCAVCGKTVCSECYRTVFNDMICDEHESLEDESAWELIAIYTDPSVVADRRFLLEENGISSITVQSDEDAVELYVPAEDKEEGFAVLHSSGDDVGICSHCQIQYSAELDSCPLCGGRHAGPEGAPEEE
jgi:RNA polymerase subunit RPABC4/transcription elongation factor Spt4